ncbi:MAG: thiopurine S-methyltransferase [Woeseiaceae bacterium]|nr:thiopurine S-methyltransferase [Woeseiaceae bacterium]
MTNHWLERWQAGRIGWHEAEGSAALRKYWTASGRRVLVPLCGKTRDLIWLEQQGNDVVGVELSEIAAEAFFEEHEIAFSRTAGSLVAYTARERRITIFCGDYFEFADAPFDGYYDRAALVAIAPPERQQYVQHTRSLLSAKVARLIISLEYDQSLADGPPYAVSAAEMAALWPELRRVASHDDIANSPPKFREAGLREMIEVVWQ